MAENVIIAVLGAANTQEDMSLNSKVDDRFGVPEQTGLTIGKAETPIDSENEADSNGNTATTTTECTTRGVDAQMPPPYELPDDAVHQQSDLEDNPLWRCVQSDMERDHGRFYYWILGDRSSEEPRAVDPVRKARYMGSKLVLTLHFPLTNDIFRFLWSLFQLLIVISIAAVSYPSYADKKYYGSVSRKKLHKEHDTAAEYIIAISLILILGDFVICTVHIASKRFWHMCCRTAPEAQPLLGGPRSSKWRAIAGWWVKYSDIPRFVLSEALFIAIYYSTLSEFSSAQFVALSFLLFMMIVQLIVLMSVLHYSTCTSERFRLPYRDVWILLGIIMNIILQQCFICLLFFFFIIPIENAFPSQNPVRINSIIEALAIVSALLLGNYMLPLLGTIIYFTLVYGGLKFAFLKTFMDFLDYLSQYRSNSSNQQEREQIQHVLDSYQYEALASSPLLHSKFRASLPGPIQTTLLGVLLILLLGSLSFVLSRILDREYVTINPIWFPRIIGLTALFHIHYIITAIVWPFYTVFGVVTLLIKFCIRKVSLRM